jgi:hypothetical protein
MDKMLVLWLVEQWVVAKDFRMAVLMDGLWDAKTAVKKERSMAYCLELNLADNLVEWLGE